MSAFSASVGWWPTGVQTGQVKLFAGRYRHEFSLSAFSRVVLPQFRGMPFVTKDDRSPCPFLSSANALRIIWKGGQEDSDDPTAWAAITAVFKDGIQVEWEEHRSYLGSVFPI